MSEPEVVHEYSLMDIYYPEANRSGRPSDEWYNRRDAFWKNNPELQSLYSPAWGPDLECPELVIDLDRWRETLHPRAQGIFK